MEITTYAVCYRVSQSSEAPNTDVQKMQTQDFYSLAFNFEDEDQFESEDDAIDAALHSAAMLLIIQLRKLNQGMLTDKGVSELLDFIGPFGAGQRCFNAWCFINSGRLDGDYELFAGWLRRECSRAIESGRVKFAGQKRDRTRNKEILATNDLFQFAA